METPVAEVVLLGLANLLLQHRPHLGQVCVDVVRDFVQNHVLKCRGQRIRIVREQVFQLVPAHQILLGLGTIVLAAVDNRLQAFLIDLPLENLFLDCTGGHHFVHIHPLLLTIPPHPGRRLLVVSGVPRHIKQDQPVATDKVQPAPTSFGRE